MNIDHYLIAKLAEIMWSLGATSLERTAIGCMVRNRAQNMNNWVEALNSMGEMHGPQNPYDPAFLECLWSADSIYHNRTADNTYGAVEFNTEPRSVNFTKIGKFYFVNSSQIVTTERPKSDLPVFEN